MRYLMTLFLIGLTAVLSLAQADPFAAPNPSTVQPPPAMPKDSSIVPPRNAVQDPEFDRFLQSEIRFTVPVMTVQQLKEMKAKQQKVVILDARSREEYEISHIEGARRVGYDDFSVEKVWNIDRGTKVVVYCGIGERSEKIGERLKQMGFKDVNNLYGSLIEWTNQGNPVVDKNGKPTKKVHIYDKNRTRWLKNGKPIF